VAELRPLADDLTEEARALAEALRDLFTGLEVSVRRYAARHYRDAGTLSRYLSGTRIPPWDVVMTLLTDLVEHRGAPMTPEATDLLRELHDAAVQTSTTPKQAMEMLEAQLADADRAARLSTDQGDVIGEALLDRRHRIADLEVRLGQLEAERRAERARADELEAQTPHLPELVAERNHLRDQVDRLSEELNQAHARRELAEERCALLERQLTVVEAAPASIASLADPTQPCHPKVLIVDDEPKNLLAMTAVLSGLDQELVAASNGREALRALLDYDDFAVIILDVQMPDMDGYETAAHIKRRPRSRDIPIIFLTAMGDQAGHAARGYAAGAVDYIHKPCDHWALRAKISVFTEIYMERRGRER